MTTTLPTSEPLQFSGGDLVQWTKAFADFAPPDWTLAYRLILPTAVNATVTSSGGVYTVTFNATDTDDIVAQTTVRLVGYVTNGTDRKTVYDGFVTIRPNPATATAADLATHESRCLALIEAAIEGDLPTHMREYTVDGRHVSKIEPRELLALRDKYRILVWRQRNPGKSWPSHAVRFANA